MNIVSKTATILLPLAVLAFVGVSAAAETRSTKVSYADLNLATPSGVAILEKRIVHAAKQVCGSADIFDRLDVMDMEHCRTKAIGDAVPRVALAVAEARLRQASAETGNGLASSR